MDVEKIKAVVKEDIELHKNEFSEFIITFHGGEPFLAFQQVRELCEWVWNSFDTNIIFTTTTNGTILTPEIKDWLQRNKKRFIPILSLDGPKKVHDLNRNNSFDRIDIDFFSGNWPKQWVKMTVAPNTLADLYDSVIYLQDRGVYANPTLAREVEWDTDRDLPILAREISKLTGYYLAHPNISPGQLLDLPLHKFSPSFVNKNINSCGAGFNIVAFDVSGNKYPCQTFISDLSAEYDKEEFDEIFNLLSRNQGMDITPECEGCPLLVWCTPCYGINYAYRHNMGAFDRTMCAFNRVVLIASAQMYAQMLPQKAMYKCLDGKTEMDIYHMAAGIKNIFETIHL